MTDDFDLCLTCFCQIDKLGRLPLCQSCYEAILDLPFNERSRLCLKIVGAWNRSKTTSSLELISERLRVILNKASNAQARCSGDKRFSRL